MTPSISRIPDAARGQLGASRVNPGAVAAWLYAVAALVVVMVVVGGITRLTESGLSITEWRPITGAVPPLNEADWLAEFALYQRTTEFQTVNRNMTLDAFKSIYFWEWAHRQLGRLIGLAYAVPLAWFWLRGAIPAGYKTRLVAVLGLGALQAVIGWWMVTSGLIGATSVSHVRLAVHLNLAFIIIGALVWTAADLRAGERARLTALSAAALAILFIQTVIGAFVAGLDAGYAFSSWPLMGDTLYPAAAPWIEPAWRNLVDNPVAVQFVHRWFAFVAAAALGLLAMRAAKAGGRGAARLVALFLALQILLGIATLLTGVDIVVAVAHQGVAALLIWASVAAAHALGRR